MILDKEIGHLILVTKSDGYRHKGTLIAFDTTCVKLRFYDGKEEMIPLASISKIEATQ
jgi:hypothetical protein